MASLTRREFVGSTAVASYMTARAYSQIAGAGERLRIGVIGCGGMATEHMKSLVRMREGDNFEIAAVCDIFDKRAEAAAQRDDQCRLERDACQPLEGDSREHHGDSDEEEVGEKRARAQDETAREFTREAIAW